MVELTQKQKEELKEYSIKLAQVRSRNQYNKNKSKLPEFCAIFQELDEKGYVDLIPLLSKSLKEISYDRKARKILKMLPLPEVGVLSYSIIGDEFIYGPQQDNMFKLIEIIGAGGQGTVYTGEQGPIASTERKKIILKMHPTTECSSIYNEGMSLLSINNHVKRTPKRIGIYLSDKIQEIRGTVEPITPVSFLLMEYLGKSIEQVMKESGGKLDAIRTIAYTAEIFLLIWKLHESAYIHRDVKPSNFTLGAPGSTEESRIHMIDLGLVISLPYPPMCKPEFLGTPLFASKNAHENKHHGNLFAPKANLSYIHYAVLYYRDDLISIGYMLVYLMTGSLPWDGPLELDQVKAIKDKTSNESLCSAIEQINIRDFTLNFLEIMYSLGPTEKPNYEQVYKLFVDLGRELGVEVEPKSSVFGSQSTTVSPNTIPSRITSPVDSKESLFLPPSKPTSKLSATNKETEARATRIGSKESAEVPTNLPTRISTRKKPQTKQDDSPAKPPPKSPVRALFSPAKAHTNSPAKSVGKSPRKAGRVIMPLTKLSTPHGLNEHKKRKNEKVDQPDGKFDRDESGERKAKKLHRRSPGRNVGIQGEGAIARLDAPPTRAAAKANATAVRSNRKRQTKGS